MIKVEIKLTSDDFETERIGKKKTYKDNDLDFDQLREVINELDYFKQYYQGLSERVY